MASWRDDDAYAYAPPPSLLAQSRALVARPPLLLANGAGGSRDKRIRVCVRVRPFTKNEAVKAGGKAAWTWHGNSIYQQIFPAQAPARKPRSSSNNDKLSAAAMGNGGLGPSPSPSSPASAAAAANAASAASSNAHLPSSYSFDYLYGPQSPTSELYDDAVRDAIVAAVDGYHSSVFVYGQTGTGKTHTMLGSRSEPGLIQLAVEDIFDHIARHAESEFLLRFSYLEIYNERVHDLLAGGARSDIKIFEVARKEDGASGSGDAYVCNDVIVKGLTEEILVSVDHVLALVEAGNFHRHTASTEANDQSSRSHSIFRLVIESQTKPPEHDGFDGDHDHASSVLRSATLNLIDLAGSESVRLANTTGQALEEGRHINRSLLTLGHIIWKLSRASSKSRSAGDAQPQHLPYRNSKLTRILQPALGGKAQITIVCTIAPSVECIAETHSTLKFASRARRVKSRLSLNESTGESALLKKYRNRIKVLQDEWDDLEAHRAGNAALSPKDAAAIEQRQVELQFAIENINRVILNSSHRQGGGSEKGTASGAESSSNNEEDDDDDDDDEDDENEDEEDEEQEEDEEAVEEDRDEVAHDGRQQQEIAVEEIDDDGVGDARNNGYHGSGETKADGVGGTPPYHGRSPSPYKRFSSSESFEPESEGSVTSSSLRRNLSVLSDDSSRSLQSLGRRRRSSLMTVLKAKYIAELQRLDAATPPPLPPPLSSSSEATASNALPLSRDSPTNSSDTSILSTETTTTAKPPVLTKGSSGSQRELIREFVRGLEIAEAENDTRLSQIRELELENRHLRELLRERDDELAALRELTTPTPDTN